MARRPTMAEIARRAGVSRTAVSYSLNGQAGVSEPTRQRVLQIAAELGFEANIAAKAMRGAATRTVGLALQRPKGPPSIDAFRSMFIGGVEAALQEHSYGLLIQFVVGLQAEIDAHDRWWDHRSVDGFLMLGLRAGDPRVRALERLSAPAVVVGGPDPAITLPNLWTDSAAAITEAVEYLVRLGHRRIVRVAGPPDMLHVAMRSRAFDEVCRRLGIADAATTVSGVYSREEGQQATRILLSSTPRPTAIIYDNDITALAGLAVASEMRVPVPAEVSLVGWEDSLLCEVVHPALTVLRRDVVKHGWLAAELLMEAIKGHEVNSVRGETPRLLVRGSTGPAPA